MGELLCRGVCTCAGESRGEAASRVSPRLRFRSKGRRGLTPNLPSGSGAPLALFPPSLTPAFTPLARGSLHVLMLAGRRHVTAAVLPVPWGSAVALAPAPLGLGKEVLVYLSKWKEFSSGKEFGHLSGLLFL